MRILFFLGFLICHTLAEARVTPTQINPSQVKVVTQKLSGVFSTRTANDPNALGEDFELEISAFLQDLDTSELTDIDPLISDQFLDSIITLKKGLYWNIDFSISTALPIPSNLISGFSFNLEHTGKLRSLTLKTDLYISHYNLNDILNNEAVGLSLIVYKKLKHFHIGLGGNIESTSGVYNENFFSAQLTNTETNKVEFLETSLISKVSTRIGTLRFTASYVFRDSKNSFYSFAIGKRF